MGFVNDTPGSRRTVSSPRGLTPVAQVNIATVLRSIRQAAGYLAAIQGSDGGLLMFWDPAAGFHGGCKSVVVQEGTAAALGTWCELQSQADALKVCQKAIAWAVDITNPDPQAPGRSFTREVEGCHPTWELEGSAQTLRAICRYHRASGREEAAPWIRSLAEFLLFMQSDDGLFYLKYDDKTGKRSTPASGFDRIRAQTRAILGLTLAYRELQDPAYLMGAKKGLQPLLADEDIPATCSAGQAQGLCTALLELNSFLPEDRHVKFATRIASARLRTQLQPKEAPAPDLVGGALPGLPPKAEDTANDLVVFASTAMMEPDAQYREAARRAAGYLMWLQFVPQNSYYLPDPGNTPGGFREWPGANVIRLQTMDAALRGMVLLARLELQERKHD